MSSILKALKKLEHERSERSPDLLKIDSDILKTTDARSSSPVAMALLLLLVFGVGAAITYYFIKDANTPLTTTQPRPAVAAKSHLQPVDSPSSSPDALPPEIEIVPARREPAGEKVSHIRPKKLATIDKLTNTITAGTPGLSISKKSNDTDIERKKLLSSAKVPTLRVNGIAFQNSAEDSMAIINGVPVSRGSLIEGSTVEEIRKDRVLFQCNGEKFEIQLGQSNR